MSILITGHTGFVGQNLKKHLETQGLTFEIVDLRNVSTVKISKTIKTVIHLAGKAHDLKGTNNDDEYFEVNTELTKKVYDSFKASNAESFIFLSSVKAVADKPLEPLLEAITPNPITPYGKSKLAAEQYLLSHQKINTHLYILRPCMIHGPGNKGNLNLLYRMVKKGIPYPLGKYVNERSYLSIDNLCFVLHELILNKSIPSGIYNVADKETYSTNEVIQLIAETMGRKAIILSIPHFLVEFMAFLGDKVKLPLTTERLQKLTENYVVSNAKIIHAMGKDLPDSAKKGFIKTFNSFSS